MLAKCEACIRPYTDRLAGVAGSSGFGQLAELAGSFLGEGSISVTTRPRVSGKAAAIS